MVSCAAQSAYSFLPILLFTSIFFFIVLQSHDQVLGVSDQSPRALLLTPLTARTEGLLGGWVLREEAALALLGLCLSSLLPSSALFRPDDSVDQICSFVH